MNDLHGEASPAWPQSARRSPIPWHTPCQTRSSLVGETIPVVRAQHLHAARFRRAACAAGSRMAAKAPGTRSSMSSTTVRCRPASRHSPSAPMRVETTGVPLASASRIFSREPPPMRSGTTIMPQLRGKAARRERSRAVRHRGRRRRGGAAIRADCGRPAQSVAARLGGADGGEDAVEQQVPRRRGSAASRGCRGRATRAGSRRIAWRLEIGGIDAVLDDIDARDAEVLARTARASTVADGHRARRPRPARAARSARTCATAGRCTSGSTDCFRSRSSAAR